MSFSIHSIPIILNMQFFSCISCKIDILSKNQLPFTFRAVIYLSMQGQNNKTKTMKNSGRAHLEVFKQSKLLCVMEPCPISSYETHKYNNIRGKLTNIHRQYIRIILTSSHAWVDCIMTNVLHIEPAKGAVQSVPCSFRPGTEPALLSRRAVPCRGKGNRNRHTGCERVGPCRASLILTLFL